MIRIGLSKVAVLQRMISEGISEKDAEDILSRKIKGKVDTPEGQSASTSNPSIFSNLGDVKLKNRTNNPTQIETDKEIDEYIISIQTNDIDIIKLITFLNKIYYTEDRLKYFIQKLKQITDKNIIINPEKDMILLLFQKECENYKIEYIKEVNNIDYSFTIDNFFTINDNLEITINNNKFSDFLNILEQYSIKKFKLSKIFMANKKYFSINTTSTNTTSTNTTVNIKFTSILTLMNSEDYYSIILIYELLEQYTQLQILTDSKSESKLSETMAIKNISKILQPLNIDYSKLTINPFSATISDIISILKEYVKNTIIDVHKLSFKKKKEEEEKQERLKKEEEEKTIYLKELKDNYTAVGYNQKYHNILNFLDLKINSFITNLNSIYKKKIDSNDIKLHNRDELNSLGKSGSTSDITTFQTQINNFIDNRTGEIFPDMEKIHTDLKLNKEQLRGLIIIFFLTNLNNRLSKLITDEFLNKIEKSLDKPNAITTIEKDITEILNKKLKSIPTLPELKNVTDMQTYLSNTFQNKYLKYKQSNIDIYNHKYQKYKEKYLQLKIYLNID